MPFRSKAFPFFRQLDAMDCGPACLRMIAAYHGRSFSLLQLRQLSFADREGVSVRGITEAAERIGLSTLVVKVPLKSEISETPSLQDAPLPAIAHWRQQHFVVVYRVSKKYVWIADPAKGKLKLTQQAFAKNWQSDGDKGVLILLDPLPAFYEQDGEPQDKTRLSFVFQFLRPYRRLLVQLIIGLVVGSLIQLLFPFLTQAIVDTGIQNQDIGFIYLILLAQLLLFVGETSVTVLQSWILLHISTRVNVALLSDFLIKLMRLPIGFFDTKMIGDLLQRIADHRRVEQFLTTSSLTTLFSAFSLIIFGAVLWWYDGLIFLIFLLGSLLYVGWILFFLKKRRQVDYQLFDRRSENQSILIELIQAMPEIKLQQSERKHRWEWAQIQAKLFRSTMRALAISQWQDVGANFFNQLKNILITFVAALAVLEGSMTLGMLLAVQYIVGQLNVPLRQLIGFIRTAQDAKISLERMGEIHRQEEEEFEQPSLEMLPETGDLQIENLSFRYNELADLVLKNITMTIPRGKVTAIVGTSGSGKTTLVKLLLCFYRPTQGTIRLGGVHLQHIGNQLWRKKCGAVLQDGYIFSDTIANNIAESEDTVDKSKLLRAVQIANIQPFIESLPLGYNTKIGARGNGISQGQRQRLLIARAVYKDPEFLFFDEATNALDAKNERIILEHLQQFFQNRTVLVVAHRLSTVRHADQIVVLENGEVLEVGTHKELTAKRGAYYQLVKNQLELGL